MKNLLGNIWSLMLQLLIIVWIWTFGLLFLGLCWVYFKTKEFIQIRILKREP